MVDYMFNGGHKPESLILGDIDSCAGINIPDLVSMVSYLFHGLELSCACLECTPFSGGSFYLDHVDGLNEANNMMTEQPITFYIRGSNDINDTIIGISNGFCVYSPSGAKWTTTKLATTDPVTELNFDSGYFVNQFGVIGTMTDTVSLGCYVLFKGGMLDNFEDNILTITIGPIDDKYHGHEICLDSSWYFSRGTWLWVSRNKDFRPTWDGPYCFPIDFSGRTD